MIRLLQLLPKGESLLIIEYSFEFSVEVTICVREFLFTSVLLSPKSAFVWCNWGKLQAISSAIVSSSHRARLYSPTVVRFIRVYSAGV